MAGTGTVSVLAHRAALVFSRHVVVGMASGAVRAVCRCCPGGGLGVALVACCAQRVATVIPRVFRRSMVEINGQPAGRSVAAVTLQTGAEVVARFARRLCAVMTRGTGTGYAVVVEISGYPAGGAVAVIALSAGLYMAGRLAGRGTAIVASGTSTW